MPKPRLPVYPVEKERLKALAHNLAQVLDWQDRAGRHFLKEVEVYEELGYQYWILTGRKWEPRTDNQEAKEES